MGGGEKRKEKSIALHEQGLGLLFYEDSVNASGHYSTWKAWYKIASTRYKTQGLKEPGESVLVNVK